MDWVDIISRFVVAIPKPVGRALIFPLHVLPSFRKAKRVLRVVDEVSGLERCGNFDAAEQIREQALRLCEPGFTAPLWRSKGFDRLRRNMPDEALAAFEQGITQLEKRPMMYGVSQPHELYYGAALAALGVGERERAKGYYRSSANLTVHGLRKGDYGRWWEKELENLRRRLGEPTRV